MRLRGVKVDLVEHFVTRRPLGKLDPVSYYCFNDFKVVAIVPNEGGNFENLPDFHFRLFFETEIISSSVIDMNLT